jgi:DNA polymerase III subunit delta'
MGFTNVIGQQTVTQKLVQLVQHNRLSHALLFLGKEGSGALPLALAFAQYVVCKPNNNAADAGLFGAEPATEPATKTTDSCGQCNNCKKAQQFLHPDIHFSYPVIPKKSGDKPTSTDFITEWRQFIQQHPYGNVFDWLQFIGAENKQGNITAHECAEILRKLSLKSFEAEYKVLVMWMPEYLGKEGNKLLKLIEEPPANTLFILVAENENDILPTILSRTQLVRIPPLQTTDIQQALVQRANVPADKALQIAQLSHGNYHEALTLNQHTDNDWQPYIRDWLNTIIKTNIAAQQKWIEEIAKLGREKQKQFLTYFIHLLQQAVLLQHAPSMANNMVTTEKDFAERLNKITQAHQQQVMVDELTAATYYIERNANIKILLQALSIKLMYIIKNNTKITTV